MHFIIATKLKAPASQVWQEVQTSRLLNYVVSPLVKFRPLVPDTLPEIWQDGKYLVQIRLFGFIPFGNQWIVISQPSIGISAQTDCHQILDDGHSEIISRWHHLITICAASEGTTNYSDEVNISAGLLTLIIWTYAQIFYRYRQMRWRKLVANAFDYRI